MKVLAIETSSLVASCAVCEDEKVLAKFNVSTGLFHSETLMVLVDELFKISKIKLEEINAVAVSVGPGSFTGLRIGVAAAKGIAMISANTSFMSLDPSTVLRTVLSV